MTCAFKVKHACLTFDFMFDLCNLHTYIIFGSGFCPTLEFCVPPYPCVVLQFCATHRRRLCALQHMRFRICPQTRTVVQSTMTFCNNALSRSWFSTAAGDTLRAVAHTQHRLWGALLSLTTLPPMSVPHPPYSSRRSHCRRRRVPFQGQRQRQYILEIVRFFEKS